MNITQEKVDNLNSVVKINMTPDDYSPRVEKAIKEQAKKAKIPGFRPGMVPASHIKKMYGKSILVDEINNMLSDTLNKYLEDERLEVLGQPLPKMEDEKNYNWDFNDNFEFNYEVGLAPGFEIDFTKDDKLIQYVIKADDDTLNSRIKSIRRSYGKMTNPDVSADGDVLYADLIQLSPDGSVFDNGITNTASLRLDLVKDEAVKAELIGLKKGDEVVVDLQKAFSGDAPKIAALLKIDEASAVELKSEFKLVVKNVNRLEESDLNQEFFDKLFGEGKISTEEGFRAEITREVESMLQQDAERKLQDDMYLYGLNKVDFELPDKFLKRWLKASNDKLTEEELAGGYKDFAQNLKWTLIENKIMKAHDIKVDYEDILEIAKVRLGQQFQMYSPQPIADEEISKYAVQYLQNKENASKIFEEVKALKVFDYIRNAVTLEPNEISNSDFKNLTV